MATKIFAPLILFVLLGVAVAVFWRDIARLDPENFQACEPQHGEGKKECLDRVLAKMKDHANWSKEEAARPGEQSRWATLANEAIVVGSMAAVPKLYLKCVNGWAEAGVDWGLALPEQNHLRPVDSMIYLRYGIDEIPRIKDYWKISDNRNQTVSRTSVALLRDISGHNSLMFMVEEDDINRHFAYFTLTGIDDVVVDLRSRCRTTLLPT